VTTSLQNPPGHRSPPPKIVARSPYGHCLGLGTAGSSPLPCLVDAGEAPSCTGSASQGTSTNPLFKPQSTDQARRRDVGGLMSRQKRGSGRRGRGQRVMIEVWRPWWPQACLKLGQAREFRAR